MFSLPPSTFLLNYHPGILIRSASLPFPAAMTLLSICGVCILFFRLLFLCFSVCCLPTFLLILLPPTLLSSSRLSFFSPFLLCWTIFYLPSASPLFLHFLLFYCFFFLIISLAHSTYLFRLIFPFSYHFLLVLLLSSFLNSTPFAEMSLPSL